MLRFATPPRLLAATILLCASPAYAWLRPPFEDAEVVERSELIVVGHLEKSSIVYVPHEAKPDRGRSWEHHATLVPTEVLKGKTDEKELPIILHYGLTPVVGGHVEHDGFRVDRRGGRKDYPKDIIEVLDTGSSARGRGPLVKDAAKDNLWFLRRRGGRFGRKPGTGKLGIVDPQDLQPLALKDYFLAYLAEDPEKAVREQRETNPAIAERAQRFLDHLQVQRILKINDPQARLHKLLPYYLRHVRWGMKNEARDGIVACGNVAGPHLRKLFDDPKHHRLRQDIMLLWRDIRYDGCVDLLIGLLNKHDQFWAGQQLDKGWWNANVGSELTRKRRDIYGEVYYGVCALRGIGDRRARQVIEHTKRRWDAIGFSNPQIVEECARALKEWSRGQ